MDGERDFIPRGRDPGFVHVGCLPGHFDDFVTTARRTEKEEEWKERGSECVCMDYLLSLSLPSLSVCNVLPKLAVFFSSNPVLIASSKLSRNVSGRDIGFYLVSDREWRV